MRYNHAQNITTSGLNALDNKLNFAMDQIETLTQTTANLGNSTAKSIETLSNSTGSSINALSGSVSSNMNLILIGGVVVGVVFLTQQNKK